MELMWTKKAFSNISRLYEFLASADRSAAAQTVQRLVTESITLLINPSRGERLEQFESRDVRRIYAGHYEIRYEIMDSTIYLLCLWHTREQW